MSLPIVLVPHPHVRCDERILAGSPHIVGTRIPVRRLFAFYRDGADLETLRKRYPALKDAQIFDALAFALDNPEVIDADIERERALLRRGGRQPPRPTGPEQSSFTFFEPGPRGGGGRARR